MCNVRKRETWEREGGRADGGEIPRRLTISSIKQAEKDLPFCGRNFSADSLCRESSALVMKRDGD